MHAPPCRGHRKQCATRDPVAWGHTGHEVPLQHANACLPAGHAEFRWPCGLMDKALVFGTKDCRFESCQGHILSGEKCWSHLLDKRTCNFECAQRKPSLHWGLNPGPSVYKTDALPLSYRGHANPRMTTRSQCAFFLQTFFSQTLAAKTPNARKMDTLGIEPRASRMLSGCDTTTPCAPWSRGIFICHFLRFEKLLDLVLVAIVPKH